MNKQIHVTYFAILREQRGLSSEKVSTAATTARELFLELALRHRFSLPVDRVRVAINGEFAAWDSPIQPEVNVALIPPVAGG